MVERLGEKKPRDLMHRTHSFRGVGENNPPITELRGINSTVNYSRKPLLGLSGLGSSVEDQVCFAETVGELGTYFFTLTDAEVVAVQAQMVLPLLRSGDQMTSKILNRLGVSEERLTEIREEMKIIIFGQNLI